MFTEFVNGRTDPVFNLVFAGCDADHKDENGFSLMEHCAYVLLAPNSWRWIAICSLELEFRSDDRLLGSNAVFGLPGVSGRRWPGPGKVGRPIFRSRETGPSPNWESHRS
jgi:hypothetical protein